MSKKLVNFRLQEKTYQYLLEKSEEERRTQVEIVEELLRLDKQKKNGYIDDLANEIYKRFDEKIKSIRIAVNENNKILKMNQKVLNYLLLAQGLKMPYNQYEDFKHPAIQRATEEVKKEIKELQVIKATQRKKSQEKKENEDSEFLD